MTPNHQQAVEGVSRDQWSKVPTTEFEVQLAEEILELEGKLASALAAQGAAEALEAEIDDLQDQVEELLHYREALIDMIDRLAMIGLIESDPHTKMLYREGKKAI